MKPLEWSLFSSLLQKSYLQKMFTCGVTKWRKLNHFHNDSVLSTDYGKSTNNRLMMIIEISQCPVWLKPKSNACSKSI